MYLLPSLSYYGTYDSSRRPELWNGVVLAMGFCLGPRGGLRPIQQELSYNARSVLRSGTNFAHDKLHGIWGFQPSTGGVFNYGSALQYTPYTCVGWLYSPTTSCIFAGYDTATPGYMLGVDSTNMTAMTGSTTATVAHDGVLTGWHCYVATKTGSAVEFFKDGVSIGTGTTTTGAGRADNIGGAGASSTDGYIADVVIYNRVLTRQEIELLSKHPGILYEPKPQRRYFYQTDTGTSISGTVSQSLAGVTLTGSGYTGSASSSGVNASQPLAFNLSDSLSVGG